MFSFKRALGTLDSEGRAATLCQCSMRGAGMRKAWMVASAVALATPGAAAPGEIELLPVKADAKAGKLLVTLPPAGPDGVSARYIYVTHLDSGLGSAAIVLDRGVTSESRLLTLRRVGPKVIAEIENPRFVAPAGNADEQKLVRNAFATSILWIGKVEQSLPGGRFTVDLTSFLMRDDMNIASALKEGDGDYKFEPEFSAVDFAATRVFPTNAEFATQLTFRAETPKAETRNITPQPGVVTLAVRHSLIALPPPGFVERSDPYGYTMGLQKVDASTPLGQPMVRDLIFRFRLEKVDPAAARSPVRKPIIFYVDRGAPEPVRTALVEGVSWWRGAFDKAGLIDAFRVELLPIGADPLDLRYNVVNWVNRATRGWSYGGPSIADPRTGEILKGSVKLGSLRVRQDILIFQALVGAGLTGTGDPDDPITAALARIRQLGAHEVGHALGFQHNFAASTQGRYSVLDYPAPRVTIRPDGRLSLVDAYGSGIGRWDEFVVDYAYGARTDAEARPKLVAARAEGLRFVSDPDSRAASATHPDGSLWDDSGDPLGELTRVMTVRRAALARFGVDALPAAASQSELRRSFVPIWLLHRYQVEAAAKFVGGVRSPFVLAGEAQNAVMVPGAGQRRAIDLLLSTLSPAELTVPSRLLPLLSAGYSGSPDRQSDIEIMPTAGGPVFDPQKAGEIAAVQTLNALFDPARLNRLELHHQADPSVPTPHELVQLTVARTVGDLRRPGDELQRRIATTTLLAIARAARRASLSPSIAVMLDAQLTGIARQLERSPGRGAAADWARGMAALLSDREALDKAIADPARLPVVPPGMPI